MYNDFTFNILDLPNQFDNWEAGIIYIFNETWNKNIVISNIYRLPRYNDADYDLCNE